jgi:hypothetical protein
VPRSGGVLAPYAGADPVKDLHLATPVFEPQLDQIDDHLNHNGTGFKSLDALIVNVGGNDAGFASYVAACANVLTKSSPDDNCTTDTDLAPFRDARLALLPGRFDRLAGALEGARLNSADAELSPGHTPEAVVMTAVPAIARKTSTTFCNSEPSGDQTSGVTSKEAQFLESTVRAPLDAAMHDAADEHGWAFVGSHVDDFHRARDLPNRPLGQPEQRRPAQAGRPRRHRLRLGARHRPAGLQRRLGAPERPRLLTDRRRALPPARTGAGEARDATSGALLQRLSRLERRHRVRAQRRRSAPQHRLLPRLQAPAGGCTVAVRGHVVANLAVDLDAGTISLGRGATGHGRAARLEGPRQTLGAGPVRLLLSRATFRRPARLVRAVRLNLRLVLGRSLAGHRVSVEMAATGDDGAKQDFAEGGVIQVRRR